MSELSTKLTVSQKHAETHGNVETLEGVPGIKSKGSLKRSSVDLAKLKVECDFLAKAVDSKYKAAGIQAGFNCIKDVQALANKTPDEVFEKSVDQAQWETLLRKEDMLYNQLQDTVAKLEGLIAVKNLFQLRRAQLGI
jgi:hypothetical protein